MGSVEGLIIRTRYESGNLRPLTRLDLADGSELRLDMLRVIRHHNDPRRELMEGDEVEVKITAVLRHGREGKEATMKTVTGYPHVTRDPDVRKGQPIIEGTVVSVADIARLKKQGFTEQEIFKKQPVLPSIGRVHIALCYYYDHEAEIDAFIAADEAAEAAVASGRKRGIHAIRRKEARDRLKAGLKR